MIAAVLLSRPGEKSALAEVSWRGLIRMSEALLPTASLFLEFLLKAYFSSQREQSTVKPWSW